jgi:cholesterol transport system auxiliary component
MKQLLVILFVVLVSAACSLPKSDLPPVSIYTIQVPDASVKPVTIPAHMVVGISYISPALDTNRIIVMPDANRYDYVANAAWPATTSVYVRDLVIRTFLDSHAFRSVSSTPLSGAINYSLNLQIQDFEAIYDPDKEAPRIRVRLVGMITGLDSRQPIPDIVINAEAVREATDNTMAAIIKAFESAFQQVALEIQTAVLDDISRQLKASKNP